MRKGVFAVWHHSYVGSVVALPWLQTPNQPARLSTHRSHFFSFWLHSYFSNVSLDSNLDANCCGTAEGIRMFFSDVCHLVYRHLVVWSTCFALVLSGLYWHDSLRVGAIKKHNAGELRKRARWICGNLLSDTELGILNVSAITSASADADLQKGGPCEHHMTLSGRRSLLVCLFGHAQLVWTRDEAARCYIATRRLKLSLLLTSVLMVALQLAKRFDSKQTM